MNAYELADKLENSDEGSGYLGFLALEAATMLRQQADRIAELEKEKGLPRSSPSPVNQACLTSKNNYKPYGYVWTSIKDCIETRFTKMYPNEFYKPFDIVPLYTHPVKQLSDEEIDNIGRQHLTDGDGAIEFARAIIKEITE